mgnify:CR=1 FL=1
MHETSAGSAGGRQAGVFDIARRPLAILLVTGSQVEREKEKERETDKRTDRPHEAATDWN